MNAVVVKFHGMLHQPLLPSTREIKLVLSLCFVFPRSQLVVVHLKDKITSVAYQQVVLSHVILDIHTVIQCAHPAHILTNARVCVHCNCQVINFVNLRDGATDARTIVPLLAMADIMI